MLYTSQRGARLADTLGLGRRRFQSCLHTVVQLVQIGVGMALAKPVAQMLADAYQLVVTLQATTLKVLAAGAVERMSDGATIVSISSVATKKPDPE